MNLQNIQSLGAATFALCSAPWNFLKDKLGIPPAVQKPHMRVAYYLHRLHQHESESWQMELWYFYEKFHMSAKTFDQLADKLKLCDLSQPAGIIPEVKLASVLEYLACGSIRWVCSYYGIGDGDVFGRCVDVVCEAICLVLEAELPKWTRPNLLQISADIAKYCKFPNCVGLMGEKLIGTKEKGGSGEGPDTIMMLAICKADYTFSYVHVVGYDSGANRCGDAIKEDFFRHTQLGASISNGRLRAAPADSRLGGKRVPYVLLADEWFSLERHVMTPYDGVQLSLEERIYNQRFRSALSCIDKAFKALDTKWACLRYKTYTNCDRQMAVTMACTFLHNFLVEEKKAPSSRLVAPPTKKARYEGPNDCLEGPFKGPNDCLEFDAERIRDNFKEYFVRQERCRSSS